jgi:hypothetical protein
MKSVLVINAPDNCYECNCSNEGCYLCQINRVQLEDDFQERRPDWCPLRPMPQKRINKDCLVVHEIWNEGWNACVDEMLGETE